MINTIIEMEHYSFVKQMTILNGTGRQKLTKSAERANLHELGDNVHLP
jgi:hypothetical protein